MPKFEDILYSMIVLIPHTWQTWNNSPSWTLRWQKCCRSLSSLNEEEVYFKISGGQWGMCPMWRGPPFMLRPAAELTLLPLIQTTRPSVMQSPVCNVRTTSDIQVSSWSLTHWCSTHHTQHLRYSPSYLTVCIVDTQHPPPPHILSASGLVLVLAPYFPHDHVQLVALEWYQCSETTVSHGQADSLHQSLITDIILYVWKWLHCLTVPYCPIVFVICFLSTAFKTSSSSKPKLCHSWHSSSFGPEVAHLVLSCHKNADYI